MTPKSAQRALTVDAFAFGELQGNPAAVVLATEPIHEDDMSDQARQLGHPAQAFVWHPNVFQDDFACCCASPTGSKPVLRWYGSKGQTLPLCGHATVAATLVLLQAFPALNRFEYETLKGPIEANRLEDGYVEVGLPISKRPAPISPPSEGDKLKRQLAAACGLQSSDRIIDLQSAQSNSLTEQNLLVVLDVEVDLGALPINPQELAQPPYRGFYFTQEFQNRHPKYAFKSRVFFPDMLVPEDQACGSAHTMLAPYWAGRLGITNHANVPLLGLQVSHNGAEVGCRFDKWADGGIAHLVGRGKVR